MAEAPTAQRPASAAPAATTNGASTDAPASAPAASKAKKHWLLIELDEARSTGLREMARLAGGPARDFYTKLLVPFIDTKLSEFNENREVVSARARAQAAQSAAEKAAEIAKKAQEELARVEGAQK